MSQREDKNGESDRNYRINTLVYWGATEDYPYSMTEAELEILVLAVKSGNADAFTRLYQHFNLPMRKYAIARVNDLMVADDLVQNVWLKISKRVVTLNDVSLFRSWLYKALRWEIIDWARQSSKELVTNDFVEECSDDMTPKQTSYALPALKKLNENERDTAELFYLNDLSVREISLIVGVPVGTVKSRLHRAREQLKQHMDNLDEE